MIETAWSLVLMQAVAETLHHDCYGDNVEPNSPGYQTMWPWFCADAAKAVNVCRAAYAC